MDSTSKDQIMKEHGRVEQTWEGGFLFAASAESQPGFVV